MMAGYCAAWLYFIVRQFINAGSRTNRLKMLHFALLANSRTLYSFAYVSLLHSEIFQLRNCRIKENRYGVVL